MKGLQATDCDKFNFTYMTHVIVYVTITDHISVHTLHQEKGKMAIVGR